MKIRNTAVFAGAMLALSAGMAAASPALVMGDLHLRVAPGVNNPSAGVIPGGSTVDVQRCGGGWCEVFWRGREGFVSQNYLDFGGPRYSRRAYDGPPRRYAPPRIYAAPPPVAVYPYPPAPYIYYGDPYYPYYQRRHYRRYWW